MAKIGAAKCACEYSLLHLWRFFTAPTADICLLCEKNVLLRQYSTGKINTAMNALEIIDKYCTEERLRDILLTHSRAVADKALDIVRCHPELEADAAFIEEAALLHDIGIVHVDAPAIACFGTEPYIKHGVLGAELLRNEGLERHALVCERHTGTGLTLQQIMKQGLPLPHRDMQPVSIEEQLICFADKFFSKTKLDREKTVEQARRSLEKFGEEGLVKFDAWCARFL